MQSFERNWFNIIWSIWFFYSNTTRKWELPSIFATNQKR